MKTPFVILALIIVAPTLLFGCVKKTVPPPAETKGTLVTLAQVMRRDVPVVLDSVGRGESRATPEVSSSPSFTMPVTRCRQAPHSPIWRPHN